MQLTTSLDICRMDQLSRSLDKLSLGMKLATSNLRIKKHVPTKLWETLVRSHASEREIAHQLNVKGFHVSRSTVHRRLISFRAVHASVAKSAGKSKCVLSDRTERYMVRLIRVHNFRSTAEVHAELKKAEYDVSHKTVLRKLKRIGSLHFGRPRQRVRLTKAQQAERLRWASTALADQIDWTQVFFADEKIWSCDGPVRRRKIWFDERDPPQRLLRRGALSRGLTMWGAFSLRHAPNLQPVSTHMDSTEYCNVIENGLLPFWPTRTHALYHDRLTAHTSRATQEWLRAHGLRTRLLPPKATDLNPIENLWGIMSGRVYKATKTYDSVESLRTAVTDTRASIQKDDGLRARLVGSVVYRLQQVVDRKGQCSDF